MWTCASLQHLASEVSESVMTPQVPVPWEASSYSLVLWIKVLRCEGVKKLTRYSGLLLKSLGSEALLGFFPAFVMVLEHVLNFILNQKVLFFFF